MKQRIILFFLLFTVSLTSFAGGGWPQKKGKSFLKLSQWWVVSDQHYTGSGGIDPHLTRGIFNTSFYVEYGITDRLTGIVYLPFLSTSTVNESVGRTSGNVLTEGESITGLGDTDITLKYGLTPNSSWAISASLTFGLPLGNDSGGNSGTLQTGDGEFNQMIQVDISRGLKVGNLYPYISGFTGLNNRTSGFSDEWRYGLETGLTVGKFTGILRFYGVKSLNNGTGRIGEGTSIFANNSEFSSFSPELAFAFNQKFGVSANYATAFSGRLIFANPSYSLGLYLTL